MMVVRMSAIFESEISTQICQTTFELCQVKSISSLYSTNFTSIVSSIFVSFFLKNESLRDENEHFWFSIFSTALKKKIIWQYKP